MMTEVVEKIVLMGLGALSVWSVSIIIDRARVFKKERQNFEQLQKWVESKNWKELVKSYNEQPTFVVGSLITSTSVANPSVPAIEKLFQSYSKRERLRLEKGLGVLATLGANAPFVGLFGTVLGIIRSFAYLGSQSGSQAVMSRVSQALYATAIELFVAIPAVAAFNIFSRRIKELTTQAESLRDLHLSTF